MQTAKPVHVKHAAKSLLFTAITTMAVSWPAFAMDQPASTSAHEILEKAGTALKLPSGYSAKIHQKVTRLKSSGEEWLADEDYAVHCKVTGDTDSTRQLASVFASPAPESKRVQRGGLMTANPLKAVLHLAASADLTIENAADQDAPCYQISAEEGGVTYTLFINKKDYSVRQITVFEGARALIKTSFQYKKIGGALLPEHVEIFAPATKTRTVEDYSTYSF